MKRYTSKRSCAVGLLFLLMFISLQAQAGNILISGSDGDTFHIHGPYATDVRDFLDQGSPLPVLVLGGAAATGNFSAAVGGVGIVTTASLTAITLSNFSALYLLSNSANGPGCCEADVALIIGFQPAINAFLAGGGSFGIQDYTGNPGFDPILGTSSGANFAVHGFLGGFGGTANYDNEAVTAAGTAAGFANYIPLGSWGHQGFDMNFFGGLGYVSLIDAPVYSPTASGLMALEVVLVVPAEDCAEEGGCDLGGITIELPPTAVLQAGATVSARTVLVDDDESLCGVEDRSFDVMVTPGDLNDDFVLRKEICGAPRFAIKIIETTGIDFPFGVVEITTDPSEFFENARPCQDPIPQTPAPGVDPREQDIVYWQTTDRTLMLRGKGEETTKDCGGSSRGFVRFLSYFGIGTYYFFRADNGGSPPPELDWIGNPESVEQAFIAITRVKLDDLEEATENALVVLPKKGDRSKLQQMIKNAVKLFGRGDFDGSLDQLKNYRKFVDRATFETSPTTFNHNGELRWRVDNAIFMHEVKVIPFAP